MRKTEDLVFGIRTVIEAVKEGKTINKVLIQKGLTGFIKRINSTIKSASSSSTKSSSTETKPYGEEKSSGVLVMISPVVYSQLDWVIQSIYEKGEDPFVLILDRVKDVRNFGAIARTAECKGVRISSTPIEMRL